MAQPILLSFAASKRTGLPESVTVNCHTERSGTLPNAPESLFARPGLEAFKTVATQPARLLFQRGGLFGNKALLVSEQSLYTLSGAGVTATMTGSIAGTGYVECDAALDADYNSVAKFATGTALYNFTSATNVVSQEDFPTAGGAGALSVCHHKGYWLAQDADTDAFYYQIPAATAWNPLDFASAEYQPDPGAAIRSVGDLIVLQNTATTEIWRATGDAAAPLAPYGGLKFDHGLRARASSVNCGGTLAYVDSNCVLRLFEGGDAEAVSDDGLSEQIASVSAEDLRGGYYTKNRHRFYVLHLGTEATWVFDLTTRRPTRATSNGYDFWRANLFCGIEGSSYATDALSNQVYKVDPNRRTDGSDTFTMEFCAVLPADAGPVPIANLELHCEVGGSPLSGQGSDPLIWVQVSRDGGKTYGPKKYRGLGGTGQYSKRVRWNALGDAPAPFGAIFKFGVSDPVIRRVSAVWVNVP